jgi:hypothetical protein
VSSPGGSPARVRRHRRGRQSWTCHTAQCCRSLTCRYEPAEPSPEVPSLLLRTRTPSLTMARRCCGRPCCARHRRVSRRPLPSRSGGRSKGWSGAHSPAPTGARLTAAGEAAHGTRSARGRGSRASSSACGGLPRKRGAHVVAVRLRARKHLHPHVSHRPGAASARDRHMAGRGHRQVLRRRKCACERVRRRRRERSVHVAGRDRHAPQRWSLGAVCCEPVSGARGVVGGRRPRGRDRLRGNGSLIVVVAAHVIDVVWFHIAPPGSRLPVVTVPTGC